MRVEYIDVAPSSIYMKVKYVESKTESARE